MAKIVIRNLTKTYSGGDVVALQDINLEVEPYESLCILGPSGCGKTTLLRIIDCLISRDRGEITMDGSAVTQPRPDVAMVFQHFGLFPWKRLDENIAYGLELRGSSKVEIDAHGGALPRTHGAQGIRQILSASTLRRHAATRRIGAGAGDQPFAAADGRAVRRSGRANPRADAGGTAAHSRKRKEGDDLRHPQHRRSDLARRPHRHDVAPPRPYSGNHIGQYSQAAKNYFGASSSALYRIAQLAVGNAHPRIGSRFRSGELLHEPQTRRAPALVRRRHLALGILRPAH